MYTGRLLVITGPTAVGKSDVALDLAKSIPLEIVSADSMQVYRYMDVGTAKPSQQERERVRHHLIDVTTPDKPFSVADYQGLALMVIDDIHRRSRLPTLVGGTGLYIKAVTDLYVFEPLKVDTALRERLWARARENGPQSLHSDLAKVDPESARRIHPNDARRIIRALEVYLQTGKTISESRKARRARKPFSLLMVGLAVEREHLYRRIDERVDQMMQKGFLEEVRLLLEMGYGPDLYPMQSLGYREMTSHLMGEIGLDEAVENMKRNTRRFAKRQYTWFKADKRIEWIDVGEDMAKEDVVEEIVTRMAGLGWLK